MKRWIHKTDQKVTASEERTSKKKSNDFQIGYELGKKYAAKYPKAMEVLAR